MIGLRVVTSWPPSPCYCTVPLCTVLSCTEEKHCKVMKSVFSRLVPVDLRKKGTRKRYYYLLFTILVIYYYYLPVSLPCRYSVSLFNLQALTKVKYVYRNVCEQYQTSERLWEWIFAYIITLEIPVPFYKKLFFFFCTIAYEYHEWSSVIH